MKKLYFMMLSVLMAVMASAQTTTEEIPFVFALYLDDPSLCVLLNSDYQQVPLTGQETVIETTLHQTTYTDGSSYGYIDSYYLYIADNFIGEYLITDCKIIANGTETTHPYFWGRDTSLNLTSGLDASYNGCTIKPVISGLNDLRTAKATVIVDDASAVRLSCGGYYPTLENGTNTVAFDPNNESNWQLGSTSYGRPLNSVKVNGREISSMFGTYYFTANDNDVIEIVAQTSSEPVNVNITFANEGTEGAVAAVSSFKNYTPAPIDDWRNGFQVSPYDDIILTLNQNDYNITSVTLNGEEQAYYASDLYLTIMQESEIVVTATKYSTFPVTLNITNPSHVNVSLKENQYGGGTQLTDLVAGTQTISVSEKMTGIEISPVSGFNVDEISYVYPGEEKQMAEAGYSGYYIALREGMQINIITSEKVRSASATLWINDVTKLNYLSVNYADGTEIFNTYGDTKPVTGEQTFTFDPASDNPIDLYFTPTDYDNPGYVLINNELQQPRYYGSTSYLLTIADGDVVKIYASEVYDPNTSGIESIAAGTPAGNEVYGIMGNKLPAGSALAPGFYIINGKKVLVK